MQKLSGKMQRKKRNEKKQETLFLDFLTGVICLGVNHKDKTSWSSLLAMLLMVMQVS